MRLVLAVIVGSLLFSCWADGAPAPRPRAERPLGRAAATGTIERARIVSRIGDRGVADELPKRARRDDGVTLYLAIEVTDGPTRRWYSDAGRIRVAGASI